jgi:hypothetical protein
MLRMRLERTPTTSTIAILRRQLSTFLTRLRHSCVVHQTRSVPTVLVLPKFHRGIGPFTPLLSYLLEQAHGFVKWSVAFYRLIIFLCHQDIAAHRLIHHTSLVVHLVRYVVPVLSYIWLLWSLSIYYLPMVILLPAVGLKAMNACFYLV